LVSQGAAVVVTDKRQQDDLDVAMEDLSQIGIRCFFGDHPINLLDECDLVCPSGGVPLTIPLLLEARARGIPLSNDSQIFLEAAPCMVIGITGSAGKTTTTALLGRMVESAFGPQKTWIGGNIGNPLITDLPEMEPNHVAVVELSSFQLEIMTRSPQIAAVLNITPNHLDRHLTMEAYVNAKAQILYHQNQTDTTVLNREDPETWKLRHDVQGKMITFGKKMPSPTFPGIYLQDEMIKYWNGKYSEEIFSKRVIALRGEHNLKNVLAACAIAKGAGVSKNAMAAGVAGYSGEEHRLEFVRTWGGADWYNDSIATAPERAMAAILSFDEPIVLLAGGRDKNLPWKAWSNLVREKVAHLIIFGEAKEIITQSLSAQLPSNQDLTVDRCESLKNALAKAAEIVEPGDVVLLSPGGTSFDEFRDFAERGEWFKKWVNELK
jgi:UDP-N-acetylmuramoylalanine--D-glutamate ligase